MAGMEFVVPVVLGVCLAAATGFRVFVPLLVLGLAARNGVLPVGESFAWVSTTPALVMLAVAAVVEVLAFYVPFLDHLLDVIAAPVAVIAGILVSAAVMTDLPPMLKWTLAIIAGGGVAGLTHAATAVLRGGSTVTTGGLGNPVVATGELLSALMISLLTVFAPYLALVAVGLFAIIALRVILRRRAAKAA